MNMYQGLNMNPVNFVDPLGEEYFIFNQDRTRVTIYENRAQYLVTQSNDGLLACINYPAVAENVPFNEVPEEFRGVINRLGEMSGEHQKRIEFRDRVGAAENADYNATAHAFNSYGGGEIEYDTFDAKTIPTDPENYPSVMNGIYRAVWWPHQRQYPALQLRMYNDVDNNRIPVNNVNQAHVIQFSINGAGLFSNNNNNSLSWWADGINIHHTITNPADALSYYDAGGNIHYATTGCLVLRYSEWNQFYILMDVHRGDTDLVVVDLDTTANDND